MDSIDNLNIIKSGGVKQTIRRFFREMNLTKKQIDERIDFAIETEDFIFFIFDYIATQYENNAVDFKAVKSEFAKEYRNQIAKYTPVDDAIEGYITAFTDEVINTTHKRLNAEIQADNVDIEGVLDNSYWLSEDRAVDMAQNMALDVINYVDFQRAKERGFKRKQWLAIEDKKTRMTHSEVDGKIIPIDELFDVGFAHMAFPHDNFIGDGASHPEELINCRCSFRYLP